MSDRTLQSSSALSVDLNMPQPFVTVQVESLSLTLGARSTYSGPARPMKAAPALFFDAQTHTIRAYVLDSFFGGSDDRGFRQFRGGLSTINLHLAKSMLSALDHDSVTLVALGDACGLSAGHFAREFKRSTGLPPHRWALSNKVSMAKDLLLKNAATLPEIATACGFVDQAHLGRWFKRMTAVSPKAWQRLYLQGSFRGGAVRLGRLSESLPPRAHDELEPEFQIVEQLVTL
jgi:AraC-like DNA-binding protein